ncbi:MAG TPA: hypothetical protein VFR86_08095 [Burkholderiaceae bacterium]|nr:hypothetical protein [Burkholderiaceae bacterium]
MIDDDEMQDRAVRLQRERRQAEQSELAQPDITRPAPSHAELANDTAAPAAPANAQRIRP